MRVIAFAVRFIDMHNKVSITLIVVRQVLDFVCTCDELCECVHG